MASHSIPSIPRSFLTMPVVPSLARVGRFLSSIFAPAAAIFGFSCILTFIFVLEQSHPGPGALQRIGWQSWDSISESRTGVPSAYPGQPSDQTTGSETNDIDLSDQPEGTDWWNVTTPDDSMPFDPASLPLDVWDPLMPHDTGCMSFISMFVFRPMTA